MEKSGRVNNKKTRGIKVVALLLGTKEIVGYFSFPFLWFLKRNCVMLLLHTVSSNSIKVYDVYHKIHLCLGQWAYF
jgi:hypothetical protein